MTTSALIDAAGSVEAVVRHYYATVSDLSSSEETLREMLADGVTITEHPNLIRPAGAVRDLEATLAGFRAGKAVLVEQVFGIHEVIATDKRAAVRATWRGVVGVDAGPLRTGQRLVAHVAALLTVRNGLVVEHETFDCYEPIEGR